MTRDDVIRSTATHIRRVGSLLAEVVYKLTVRGVVHDASKWSENEWPAFEAATPLLADLTYGTPEYKASLDSIRPAVDHHQAHNTHHPEFYVANGIEGMSLLDLMEMLADWKAAGERNKDGCLMKSLLHNKDRFEISPQLFEILVNTAREMGWIEQPQS